MHKQQTVFISVFTCKVLCFAETGSIRDGEARLSVMLMHECHQDCPLGAQNLIIPYSNLYLNKCQRECNVGLGCPVMLKQKGIDNILHSNV